jgi:hypothetical protein
MRLLLAFILPWLTFFTVGRPLAGIACLALQFTLIGWIPATIWAVFALGQHLTDMKIQALRRDLGLTKDLSSPGDGLSAAEYRG